MNHCLRFGNVFVEVQSCGQETYLNTRHIYFCGVSTFSEALAYNRSEVVILILVT